MEDTNMDPMAQTDDTNAPVEPTEEMAPAADMPVEGAEMEEAAEMPAEDAGEEVATEEMPAEDAGEVAPTEEAAM